MSLPRVVDVHPASPAARAGLIVGDEIATLDGEVPRDVIAYQLLADSADLTLEVNRGGLTREVVVAKAEGEPLGVELHSALFDDVRTCDNHCEFCFIYQLPKPSSREGSGLRSSLYVKDDDYRLSFLYGNFTTLTRFTEADLERVVTERLSPLYVSIHATDPRVRAEMLRNRRGGTSLRWLRALLDHGIEVHGQVVVCPDVNDDEVLEDTFAGVLDEYPQLADLCVVPLGVSRYTGETRLRAHTPAEACDVVELVDEWQQVFRGALGRRVVYAADEYYLLAGRSFPPADEYDGFEMCEDGVGMARELELEFAETDDADRPCGSADPWHADNTQRGGFFAWVDGAPAEGYRAPRTAGADGLTIRSANDRPRHSERPRPVTVLTGTYGAQVLEPLLGEAGLGEVRVLAVENRFFGGNIGVTGLLVGEDLARVLADQPTDHRYLLPDVCLSGGRFLDGSALADLPRPVEVVPTDGRSLRRALQR